MFRLSLVASAALFLVACNSPCDDLAARACQAAGDTSTECQQATELAAKASRQDQRACSLALELVNDLERP